MQAFKLFDDDGSGKINLKKLRRVAKELGEEIDDAVRWVMGDGRLTTDNGRWAMGYGLLCYGGVGGDGDGAG